MADGTSAGPDSMEGPPPNLETVSQQDDDNMPQEDGRSAEEHSVASLASSQPAIEHGVEEETLVPAGRPPDGLYAYAYDDLYDMEETYAEVREGYSLGRRHMDPRYPTGRALKFRTALIVVTIFSMMATLLQAMVILLQFMCLADLGLAFLGFRGAWSYNGIWLQVYRMGTFCSVCGFMIFSASTLSLAVACHATGYSSRFFTEGSILYLYICFFYSFVIMWLKILGMVAATIIQREIRRPTGPPLPQLGGDPSAVVPLRDGHTIAQTRGSRPAEMLVVDDLRSGPSMVRQDVLSTQGAEGVVAPTAPLFTLHLDIPVSREKDTPFATPSADRGSGRASGSTSARRVDEASTLPPATESQAPGESTPAPRLIDFGDDDNTPFINRTLVEGRHQTPRREGLSVSQEANIQHGHEEVGES